MRLVLLVGALALLVGCGPPAASPPPSAGGCADGSGRLEGTGLCQSEAAALLTRDPNVRTPELEGCSWAVNETMLPGDEALLYNAATCNGVATKLAFAGGAHSAEIAYERSAVFGGAAIGRVVIRLFGTDPDPQGALKAALAEAPAGERATCEIRPAGYEGWPADALLIAPSAAARAKLPKDKPIAACGPVGIDESATRFWRVRQGFAWFFDLGAEDPDFDAGNMTVIAKDADGRWQVKP
jgi:hypothetical protein